MSDTKKGHVDVEEIMRGIRREIQMEEEARTLPKFEDIPFRGAAPQSAPTYVGTQVDWRVFLESLDYVNRNYDIPYYWSFGPNRSVKVFLKRVVRKLVKCIIPPILAKQNEMGARFVRCLNQLRWFVEETNAKNAELSAEIERLKGERAEQSDALRRLIDEQSSLLQRAIGEYDARIRQMSSEYEQQISALRTQLADVCKQASMQEERIRSSEAIRQADSEKYDALLKLSEGRYHDMCEKIGLGIKEIRHIQTQLKKLPVEVAASSADIDTRLEWQFVSQTGEDMILEHIFQMLNIAPDKRSYLDLGANHAKLYSNTYYLYQKGSRGVLVEANPALIGELKFHRSEDVILNKCVSATSGQTVDFYILSGDGLSTPDKKQADEAIGLNPTIHIERTVEVDTITPNEILDKYFDGAPVFINVDIEGEDLKILESIDFEKHRPLVVSVEMIPYRPRLVIGEKNNAILKLMEKCDYIEYAFTGINSIFIDKRQISHIIAESK